MKNKLLALVLVCMLALTSVGFAAEVTPITDKPLTITAMGEKGPLNVKNYEDTVVGQWLTENLGITVKSEWYSSDIYTEKKGLAFASGDLPDLFINAGLSSVDQAKYGAQGALLPLNDLIEEYGVHTKKMFEEAPYIKALITAPDGNIYALPHVYTLVRDQAGGNRFWIHTGWLEKIGKEEPATLDEYYEVLKAFKECDYNGNGVADEIPLSGYEGESVDVMVMQALGLNVLDLDDYFDVRDGKVFFIPTDEAYHDYLAYMRKLYEEKLLDNEVFVQSYQQFSAKGAECLLGSFKDGASYYTCPNEGYEYTYMGAMTSERNDKPIYTINGGISIGKVAISVTNENPVETFKLLDWFYSEEGSIMNDWGPEGVAWEYNEDGTWSNLVGDGCETVQEWRQGYVTTGHFNQFGPDEFNQLQNNSNAMWLNQLTIDNYEPYFTYQFPDMMMTEEELETISGILTDIGKYVEEARARFIIGEDDVTADWDAYVKNFEAMHVAELLEVYQTAYDRYSAAMA